ncbi:hypothetical protein [Flammeovirga sp. SJP92]|uniref:hypothetical protein n=1 Tax=Flammeovirga sp. SJP92 TaxID=1775430 RepID=UPI000788E438|nr:hypothetical protein [Flammeovirga sp. SJP92]KXX72176.1 hypothetical protein AVL50_00840 [Flammeovirga sp. SJP92]
MRYLPIFLLISFFLGCEETDSYKSGETYIKFYGTSSKEQGIDIISLDDGYLLLGNTESSLSGSSIMLVKTDKNGNEEWQSVYNGDLNVDEPVGMIQLENDNIVILSNRNDTTGILTYTKPDGSDLNENEPIVLKPVTENIQVRYNSIETLTEGGFLIVGEIKNPQNEWDMLSMKLDDNGGIIWEKVEGYKGEKGSDDLGKSSTEDGAQFYYLFGSVDILKTNSDGEEVIVSDMRTVSVNRLGNIVWDKQVSTSDNEYGVAIKNYNGDLYILGRRESSTTKKDIIFSRLDANGNAGALIEYGGDGIDVGNDMIITPTGIFITGSSNQNSGSEDILVLKLNLQGQVIWQNTVGYEGVDFGSKVLIEEDNSIVILGTGFFGNNDKICLLKLDESGNLSKL